MSGMAEVLAAWNFDREWGEGEWQSCPERFRPGWIKDAQETLDFLTAAGFGSVAEARAGALVEAAEEIDRLRTIGRTPYAECTQNETEAFLDFAEVKPETWLRNRAAAVRGEG